MQCSFRFEREKKKETRQDDSAEQNHYLCFCVCPQETFILSSQDMKWFFEMHRVGRVHFYWHYG